MKKKEVWTLDGRKKIYCVNDSNQIISEEEDLGPLSETEFLWVRLQPGIPYKEWFKEYKKNEKKAKKNRKNE
jgi:hypothetical protein